MQQVEMIFQQESFFFLCASISTLLFLISIIFLLIGGGDAPDGDLVLEGDVSLDGDASLDGDMDFDLEADADGGGAADHHLDSAVAFKLFTTQSLFSFFMGFGWLGLTCRLEWGMGYLLSVPISFVFGATLMLVTSYLMYKVRSLDKIMKRNIFNAIGAQGEVYLSIPGSDSGQGKVQVVVEGQKQIFNAVTKDEKLESFTNVEVVGVEEGSVLVVRKK